MKDGFPKRNQNPTTRIELKLKLAAKAMENVFFSLEKSGTCGSSLLFCTHQQKE